MVGWPTQAIEAIAILCWIAADEGDIMLKLGQGFRLTQPEDQQMDLSVDRIIINGITLLPCSIIMVANSILGKSILDVPPKRPRAT
jgi:hypothetical protein